MKPVAYFLTKLFARDGKTHVFHCFLGFRLNYHTCYNSNKQNEVNGHVATKIIYILAMAKDSIYFCRAI